MFRDVALNSGCEASRKLRSVTASNTCTNKNYEIHHCKNCKKRKKQKNRISILSSIKHQKEHTTNNMLTYATHLSKSLVSNKPIIESIVIKDVNLTEKQNTLSQCSNKLIFNLERMFLKSSYIAIITGVSIGANIVLISLISYVLYKQQNKNDLERSFLKNNMQKPYFSFTENI